MLAFPDPSVSTEYTDPNGSVWEFNGTGWVRQPESSGGGGDYPIIDWDDAPAGEALFYAPSVAPQQQSDAIETTFTVPKGVDKISAVVISSGGSGNADVNAPAGAGGGLSWANEIPVTGGETLNIKIPAPHGKKEWGQSENTGVAEIARGDNRLIGAQSAFYKRDTGVAHQYRSVGGYPVAPTVPEEGGVTSGGGTGGFGSYVNNTGSSKARGGGGAGGWAGNGGNGGTRSEQAPTDGNGGAGAGAEGFYGGGTGPFELGASGSASSNNDKHGSVPLLNNYSYGAGGTGPTGSSASGSQFGFGGVIRIIWGEGRSFPATNCNQQSSYVIYDNGVQIGGWNGTGAFLPDLYIENDKMYAVYILDQRRVEALNWAAAFKLNPSTEYEYIVVGAGGWGGTGDQTSGNGGGGGGGAVTTGFITTTDGWANVKVGRSYFHDEKDGANALKHSSLLIGDTLIECHGGGQGHSENRNEGSPIITQGGCGGGSMAVESILTGPVQGFVGGMGNATYLSSGGGGGMSSAGMPAGSGKNGADGGEGILTTFFTGREEYVGCGGGSGNIGGTSGGAGGVGGNGYGGTGGGLLQGFVGLPAVGYGNGGGGAGQNNIGRQLDGGSGSHGVVAFRTVVADVSSFTTRELAEAFDPSKYACSIYRQREASDG